MHSRSNPAVILAALLWAVPPGLARSAPGVPLGRLHLQRGAPPESSGGVPPYTAQTAYFAGEALETTVDTTGVLSLREGALALAADSSASLAGEPGAYELHLKRGALRIELPPGAFRVHVQGMRLRPAATEPASQRALLELALDAHGQLFVRSPRPLDLLDPAGAPLARLRTDELAPLCALVPAALGQPDVPCLPDVAGPAQANTLALRLLGAALASAMVASTAAVIRNNDDDSDPASP